MKDNNQIIKIIGIPYNEIIEITEKEKDSLINEDIIFNTWNEFNRKGNWSFFSSDFEKIKFLIKK